ncbi:MAG: phage tail protein [Kofleriaceae bacterium]|jgi:phage tail-like protein|nr:phage tail protein [Kofleriaceae bacterium]MBP9167221.1 phage tail protein [Kofleriaceae bacterium]MBP9862887.1 phage tail protein [Kofleriaceae bacterium]
MARRNNDPHLAYCFKVQVNAPGISAVALFKSAGGLGDETEVFDYREGGNNATTHRLVGATKFKNIVLKRGLTGPEFIAWRDMWRNPGPKTRATGTIQQLDTKGNPQITWEFSEAWPCKWEMSEFDASKSEVSIETIEIAHEGLKKV